MDDLPPKPSTTIFIKGITSVALSSLAINLCNDESISIPSVKNIQLFQCKKMRPRT